jgi:hypothetical protein
VGQHEIHRDVSILELLTARIRNADPTYDSRRVTVELAMNAATARESRLESMVRLKAAPFPVNRSGTLLASSWNNRFALAGAWVALERAKTLFQTQPGTISLGKVRDLHISELLAMLWGVCSELRHAHQRDQCTTEVYCSDHGFKVLS